MHCPNCAITLEGLEDELDGVWRVSVSYRKQQVEVVYDATRVTEANIISTAQGLGYTVTPYV